MDSKVLMEQRIKRVRDTAAFKKADRVPYISMLKNWVIYDGGYGLSEAHENPALTAEALKKLPDEYGYDVMDNALLSYAQSSNMVKYTGPGYYHYNDRTWAVELRDASPMRVAEWDEYLKDPGKFIWEVVLPRKFERWGSFTAQQMAETCRMYSDYFACVADVDNYFISRGYPKKGAFPVLLGIDFALCTFFGMKETSIAMRRNPSKLKEFCDFFDAPVVASIESVTADTVPDRAIAAWDFNVGSMAHNFLSVRQFDLFYRPVYQKIIDKCNKEGLLFYLFTEGSTKQFADLYQDINRGNMILHVDQDDMYEMRKKLPNVCLCGGLQPEVLGRGTKEQCIDTVRRLIEDIGPEGGFILSEAKMSSFPTDANRENIKAICAYLASGRN